MPDPVTAAAVAYLYRAALARQVPVFRPRMRGGSSKEEHMHSEPVTYGRPPVEGKVKASTAGAYLGLLALLTVLQTVNTNLDLIAFLPDWLETLTIPLLPGLATYTGGYLAKHAPRPDLPMSQR
jgi:hypothetical protein